MILLKTFLKYKRRQRNIIVFTISTFLFACSHHKPAPVYDLSLDDEQSDITSINSQPTTYTVKRGDTLFSIAWYHSIDFQDIAKFNQLTNNLIYPGQVLALTSPQNKSFFDARSLLMALNREVLRKPVSLSQIASNKSASNESEGNKTLINSSNKKNSNSKKLKQQAPQAKQKNKKIRRKSNTKSKTIIASNTRFKGNSKKPFNWIWPANGKILSRFSARSNANRGLDISGVLGQPVRATAQGKVVYKGSGLRGYGNLVIIKHNNNYLSAYAHNSKIHVVENEVVKAGQRIADIGSSDVSQAKLHFEIRYKGKPVDPLNYLPQKKL